MDIQKYTIMKNNDNKRETYNKPEIMVIELESENVIATSFETGGETDDTARSKRRFWYDDNVEDK